MSSKTFEVTSEQKEKLRKLKLDVEKLVEVALSEAYEDTKLKQLAIAADEAMKLFHNLDQLYNN